MPSFTRTRNRRRRVQNFKESKHTHNILRTAKVSRYSWKISLQRGLWLKFKTSDAVSIYHIIPIHCTILHHIHSYSKYHVYHFLHVSLIHIPSVIPIWTLLVVPPQMTSETIWSKVTPLSCVAGGVGPWSAQMGGPLFWFEFGPCFWGGWPPNIEVILGSR